MPWYDDSWKDSYDAWKTREPDWYYDDDGSWERAAEEAADEYAAEQRPWNRVKQWWSDTPLVTWVRSRWWAWRHPRTEADDDPEVPF